MDINTITQNPINSLISLMSNASFVYLMIKGAFKGFKMIKGNQKVLKYMFDISIVIMNIIIGYLIPLLSIYYLSNMWYDIILKVISGYVAVNNIILWYMFIKFMLIMRK